MWDGAYPPPFVYVFDQYDQALATTRPDDADDGVQGRRTGLGGRGVITLPPTASCAWAIFIGPCMPGGGTATRTAHRSRSTADS